MPSNIIATSFSLIVFASAIAVGIAAKNPAETIMWRAMIAMMFCWPVGFAIGSLAQKTIERNIENYKLAHPVPQEAAVDETNEIDEEVNVDVVEEI